MISRQEIRGSMSRLALTANQALAADEWTVPAAQSTAGVDRPSANLWGAVVVTKEFSQPAAASRV
jgi:hypothetical protein